MTVHSSQPHTSLRQRLKAVAKPMIRGLDRVLNWLRGPVVIGADYVTGLENVSAIYPSTILSVLQWSKKPVNHIALGRGVYLGRRVELEAGEIEIDEDTTLQDGCAVRGRVKIGAHCLLGHNVLVISNSHRFMDNPEQLIRDQDKSYWRNMREEEEYTGDLIQIDDDCWLGWSCTVMPGVHVGRGAILSANSVITNDVGPYEIHGGTPNRKIGDRLIFMPPMSISALNDSDLPYFYQGFRHLRNTLEESRTEGAIFARSAAAIVLAGKPSAEIQIRGFRFDQANDLNLHFWLNGNDAGCHSISPGAFELTLSPQEREGELVRRIPIGLRAYTFLEWQDETSVNDRGKFENTSPRYGIVSAAILA